jgi:hypothetical protein
LVKALGLSTALPAAQQFAGDQFRRAVVVSHVEGVKSFAGILSECLRAGNRIEDDTVFLLVGNLPKAGQNSADREAGGEFLAVGFHGSMSLLRRPR